ncbi:MAG: DUF5924 family protein [Myxococcales bacterium]|jgi:hypothetical protein
MQHGDTQVTRPPDVAEPANAPEPTAPAIESRPTLWSRARKLLPWASLAVGIGGALIMDRGPERALPIAIAAVAVWVVLMGVQWLARKDTSELHGVRRYLVSVAHFSTLTATQSLVQLTLFFALPFFFRAATLDPGHAIFLAGLCLLCAVSLWDPLTEWILHQPIISALLPATGSFVALTAVLPGLGLSTRWSLWIAAITAAAGVPLLSAAAAEEGRRRRAAIIGGVVAIGLPVSLYLGAARIIPAAPLELKKAEMGTRRDGKWIADVVEHLYGPPERLICATAIYSPLGLKDQLFHVWKKDGVFRARVELDIVGGRAEGYRTQSRISSFGPQPQGEYSCTVETATGQVLGTRSVRIGPQG